MNHCLPFILDEILSDSDDDAALVVAAAHAYNSCRERRKMHRNGIVSPKDSAWHHLDTNACDQTFQTYMRFTRPAFDTLERVVFHVEEVKHQGRPPILDRRGQLALLLVYLGSTMDIDDLCMLFGVVPSSCSDYIWSTMDAVVKALSKHDHCKLAFPTEAEMQYYSYLTNRREPSTTNIIGFVDGLALEVKCRSDPFAQSFAFNGHTHTTQCNNVFAFVPTGKIVYACLNYPGSWHDSRVAWHFMEVVKEKIGEYAFVVDQGFTRQKDMEGKFLGPLSQKTKKRLRKKFPDTAKATIAKHDKYISLRQAAEWGNRALQSVFPRITCHMTSDIERRTQLLMSVVLLHNFYNHYVGINQIQTVFSVNYDEFINLEGYEHLRRYYRDA